MGEYIRIHDGDWTSAMRDAHALLAQQLCTQLSGPWLDGIVDPRHVADLRTAGWCWRPLANDRADIEREGVLHECVPIYRSPNAPRKDSVVEQVPCRVYPDRDGESLIRTTDRERCKPITYTIRKRGATARLSVTVRVTVSSTNHQRWLPACRSRNRVLNRPDLRDLAKSTRPDSTAATTASATVTVTAQVLSSWEKLEKNAPSLASSS
jgi:hypothetical protein